MVSLFQTEIPYLVFTGIESSQELKVLILWLGEEANKGFVNLFNDVSRLNLSWNMNNEKFSVKYDLIFSISYSLYLYI